jgi:hypothetical protein
VADQEIVVTGLRWQVFAAAYELAAHEGYGIRLDRRLASFTYFSAPLLHGHRRRFEVWVSELDPVCCVVHVECTVLRSSMWGSAAYEGEARRAAKRWLTRLERRRVESRTGYAQAGWYPEPGSSAQRYWSGATWTPWRWVHDGLVLDAPEGIAFAVDRADVGVVMGDRALPTFERVTKLLPPPFASPKQVVGTRRWRLRMLQDVAVVIAGAIALVGLAYLSVQTL